MNTDLILTSMIVGLLVAMESGLYLGFAAGISLLGIMDFLYRIVENTKKCPPSS